MAHAPLFQLTWQATDLERTRTFLETLLGWVFRPAGENYFVCAPGDGAVIGLSEVEHVRFGNGFVPHIAVGDLDEILERAKTVGRQTVVGFGTIPEVGRFADMRDPDGNVFTLVEIGGSRPEAPPEVFEG